MILQNVRTRIAELDCVVASSSKAEPPTLAVVLCHGYGAPGDDLVPLGGELGRLVARTHAERASGLRFYFPSSPDAAQGVPMGRAWWQLDMERLMALQRGEAQGAGLRHEEVPDGLARARRLLTAFVDAVSQGTGLPHARIVLGGFSQGGMIATDVALRHEEAPAGLAILSGTLLCASEWRRRAKARAGLRIFQSHGRRDPLLPFADALLLRALLEEGGRAVDFREFNGGHEIPETVLRGLADFTASLVAPAGQ